jgi:hypothetical protein
MHDETLCGRTIHAAPAGVDKEPVCLMHSRDPEKNITEFWTEFDRILKTAGDGIADFTRFVIPGADEAGTEFQARCIFSRATFKQNAYFRGATFTQDADFYGAMFRQNADFSWAKFKQDAYFSEATFKENADFRVATFTKLADFSGAAIADVLDLSVLPFVRDAQIILRRTNQRKSVEVPDRQAAKEENLLGRPESEWPKKTVQIAGLKLRFQNTLSDAFRFEDVRWQKKDDRLFLQDEEDLQGEWTPTHKLVAQSYRRLVLNFEKHRQYELAEDCVVGEMEMRRRDPERFLFAGKGTEEKIYSTRFRRWLGEHLSLTWLYRCLSLYGSSYRRAGVWLIALVLLIFPAFYGACGLALRGAGKAGAEQQPKTALEPHLPVVSWAEAGRVGRANGSLLTESCFVYWNVLLFSLETATFQRDHQYEPQGPGGRLVVMGQTIAVPGQLTLFLLALRRRFRR